MASKIGKILIIDDNLQNQRLADEILKDEGYTVLFANDGETGLEKVVEQEPDVILLDIMMPGIDGFEVCHRLKKQDSKYKNIKIIMLTAKTNVQDITTGFSAGADDYIKKPYEYEELIARVKTQWKLKKIEDDQRLSLSKSEHLAIIGKMVSGIAHDFGNILRVSSLFSIIQRKTKNIKNFLLEGDKDKALEMLAEIDDFSEHGIKSLDLGLSIVQGLMTYSSDAGSVKKIQKIFPLINAPLNILSRQIDSNKIKVALEVLDKNAEAHCNAAEIQQIVLNLLSNAIYAMNKTQERKLNIKLWTDLDSLHFSVRDNGIGIPEDIQSKVFNDFYTTKPNGEGTGIGLSNVQKIVKKHSGQVGLVSQPGNTKFTITLPKQKV